MGRNSLASDGNVYFGSSSHSAHHGASFFKYDSQSNQITQLAHDITAICSEDAQTNPQGKLHSDIVEANGWLYMATHFSAELPGAWRHWTGSHALGYELATGTLRDYGVIHPNYTSYSAIGVDPARNYLYVFLTGQAAGQVSYIYRIDTITGDKTNLGQVSDPSDGGFDSSSFWTFVDSAATSGFQSKIRMAPCAGSTVRPASWTSTLMRCRHCIAGTPTQVETDATARRTASSNGCNR